MGQIVIDVDPHGMCVPCCARRTPLLLLMLALPSLQICIMKLLCECGAWIDSLQLLCISFIILLFVLQSCPRCWVIHGGMVLEEVMGYVTVTVCGFGLVAQVVLRLLFLLPFMCLY